MVIFSGILDRLACGHHHVLRRIVQSMAVCMLFALPGFAARAAEPLTVYKAVLPQADILYRERVASTDALAAYLKAVESVARKSIQQAGEKEAGAPSPASGFIVVGLRPGQRSNVWLDFDEPVSDALTGELVAKIRSILPIRINDGAIVIALKVGLWGGKESPRGLPNPKEWKVAEQQSLMPLEIDELVEKIWKD